MTSINAENGSETHDSFLNKALGFKSFQSWFDKFGVKPEETLVCMEHTGLYLVALCEYLRKKGFKFSVVNPLNIKRSMGMQRVKSDKRDSWIIAQYARRFTEQLPLNCLEDTDMLKLKILNAHRERLLKHILALEKNIKEHEDTLEKEMIKEIVKDYNSVVKTLKKKLEKTETSILEMIESHEPMQHSFELLRSVPGVGEQVAIHMILCTYNFSRITDPRKFGSYAGVVPNAHESGTSLRGRRRVSPFANKKMKSLLHMAALTAVKRDGDLKAYYERKQEEGKSKMSV
ncbi:MAG: transposase, partial [Candidatus Bathyarchaeota archaeon]|nr:transposase [Candidatus Bathyarchaeota archaeon]